MKLEPWPGGRWFRDLGNNTGHLWGHVQVIKPPKVLELVGPTMMSYPVASHIQYRLTEQAGGTLLKFTHQAFGLIEPGLAARREQRLGRNAGPHPHGRGKKARLAAVSALAGRGLQRR